MHTIGKRIRSARENAKMTARELAKRLGVSPTRLSNWENGTNRPRAEYISSISRILEVSTDYLLGITAENQLKVSEESSIYSSITNVDLTLDEKKLLYLWREASYEGQQAALAVLSTCVGFKKHTDEKTGAG
ncbi:MAG: helix-turn-helix transcriptional regulator [Oscillospiraceae bacterium]|nr:helix-turn-helix transcriptional regulator [Oscillospiraceae bacterium]